MELDKRIKNNYRPLCVLDIKRAMGFIGQNGFFADAINYFDNLLECGSGKLVSVEDKKIHPFKCDNEWAYMFFIPEADLKPVEKKYRPYTLAEWVEQHEIGEVIHCRNEHKQEFHVMYTGYVIDNGEDIQDIRTVGRIMLINMGYLLQELFDRYEIEANGDWQPFGVLDEENKEE